jgi:NAD-dependent dihydropyrimidine dehydrogenase PreA subunit
MVHKHLKNVVSLSFNIDKCTGCGKCTEVCPHGVFELTEKKAQIVERDLCMECGACALNCPFKAINVEAGTGCALAFIIGWLTGKEPNCGSTETGCC